MIFSSCVVTSERKKRKREVGKIEKRNGLTHSSLFSLVNSHVYTQLNAASLELVKLLLLRLQPLPLSEAYNKARIENSHH